MCCPNIFHQAYAYVRVLRLSTQVGTRRKVKVGCIYHSKVIGLSLKAIDNAHSHNEQ